MPYFGISVGNVMFLEWAPRTISLFGNLGSQTQSLFSGLKFKFHTKTRTSLTKSHGGRERKRKTGGFGGEKDMWIRIIYQFEILCVCA